MNVWEDNLKKLEVHYLKFMSEEMSMIRKREKPTREGLEKLYWEDGLTTMAMARKYCVGRSTIFRWMDKEGIKKRNRSEVNLRRWNRQRPPKEELDRLYNK